MAAVAKRQNIEHSIACVCTIISGVLIVTSTHEAWIGWAAAGLILLGTAGIAHNLRRWCRQCPP